MKRKYFFLLIFLALILPGAGHTQDVKAIDSLTVEFWPDYDRASVLVLLTGTLPVNTKLPASVTLPFPETAQLNAVARIDDTDGIMKNDIFYSHAPGEIIFITPDLRFRLEYYFPYAANNNQRTFDFTWLADLSVKRFQLKVQQPASAISLTTVPPTKNMLRGEDGLTYYAFPVQSVSAGQSFSVNVAYTMTTAKLSVESLAPANTNVQEPGLPSTLKADEGINWPIVAVVMAGIILVIVFVWLTITRRASFNRQITHDAKAKKKSPANFCRKCGKPAAKADRFCSNCGSSLEGRA
ncbi:MAG: zinc ribbon domain-containing protein [Desulfobacteraceae bacterium]|nr:zinc ribbon domain-containing protein [Desulfobacteraceae bacterium]